MIPERVRACALRWGLTLGEPLAGGTSSAVYAVRDGAGRDLVLKLPAGRADAAEVTAAEAAALRGWSTTGVTPLLVDADQESLVLQRVTPGHPLIPVQSAPNRLHPHGLTAEVIARLAAGLQFVWDTEAPAGPFRSWTDFHRDAVRTALDDIAWERARRGEPERAEAGLRRLADAHRCAESLMAETEVSLLHGDFVAKNLLVDETSPVGWCAIDPLPYLGDPASELASFAAYQPAGSITETAEELAVAAGLDPHRVLRWTAVWLVHQVVQAWREDQAEIEALLGRGDVQRLLR